MARSYSGKLCRALNPIYAREPLSGEGARRYGGRFNPKGTPALHFSLSIMTAVREANQVGTLQPTTLVAYEAERREAKHPKTDAPLSAAERDELVRLGRENKQLRMERDILSRAAAWFARETGTIPSGSSGS